ncbi:MAG TPA: dihydrolipoamide acetyltransferase family protein, partial [Novosphingobium sp.]|nr:dihydrolipoamide acetyltransferase family protein [Novosphingobium sp.]
SPVTGTVVEIAGEAGDVIAIGSALAVIEVEGEGADEDALAPTAEAVEQRIEAETPDAGDVVRAVEADVGERASTSSARAAVVSEPIKKPAQPESVEGHTPTPAAHAKVLSTPAVRQRARELGIDLGQVKPAADGRVRHADLDAFLAYDNSGGYRPAGAVRADEQVKVIGLRRRIAENMAAAKRNIPHFSYVEECDVTALEAMRAQLNAARGDKPKLTMLPLLISAICRTIHDFPMINARFDDETGVVTRHGAVHLGMATQTDGGLMVPVIRNAQSLNLWQLAREISRLASAAREGTAKSDELSGSTLTITSLGPLGGIATTPVINRPEVAIIGPNRIVERPMFVPDGMGGERIEKRKLMNVSISCDHRVVDGWDAASFVQALRKLIEAPVLLLAD